MAHEVTYSHSNHTNIYTKGENYIMNLKQTFRKVTMSTKKHSPAILITTGIIGLGATAYLAYKSREKVEDVVIGIEEEREAGIEPNKMEVSRKLAEAVAVPVTVGILSCASIILAYRIQNNRIATLATALAAQQARNVYMENKYRKKHGEEEYQKFMTPTEDVEVETVDAKGKKKTTVEQVKSEVDKTTGQWYDQSTEYASDDHTYNMQFIESVNDRCQAILFQRGTLLLNEVRELLGFDRIRAGALLGWTTADNFSIEKFVTVMKEEGELRDQIWVTWTKPHYIFDDVEFTGRYSIL